MALAEAEPWLAAAHEALAAKLPLPPTTRAFVARPFYRPPGSHRCFYYCPSSLQEERLGRDGGRAVVAIKGLEPSTEDLDVLLQSFRGACYSPHSIAEHLILEEQKIPAGLGLAEALREARCAAEIQIAHLRAYGCLARLPFPLFVFRHLPEVEARLLESLRSGLSDAAFKIVAPRVTAGLGVYVYYYPTPPVRVRDVESLLHGLDFRQRMFALIGMCNPETIIRRWVSCFVRMLYLGTLPGALPSYRTGICCQPQNACIDGGFVDLDSLTPLTALPDDAAVYAALQFSTGALLDTVSALVTGGTESWPPEGRDVGFARQQVGRYLLTLIQEALGCEARPELNPDARINRYFTPEISFEGLVDLLNTYHPLRNFHIREDAIKFNKFWLSLIAAAQDV